jgi:hypothetical protein
VDFQAIFRWSVENGLSLNSEKTQAMIICRERDRQSALLPIVLVSYSSSVKNLGLTMDNRFSWRDQVDCVRRNVGFVWGRLWHFADVTGKKLVQTLVIPNFLYCDVIYLRASVEAYRKPYVALQFLCKILSFGVFVHILRNSWKYL